MNEKKSEEKLQCTVLLTVLKLRSWEHGWIFSGLFNAITAFQCYSSIWAVAVATA